MNNPLVHLVDDDEAIRDALGWLLRSRGVAAQAWVSGEAFLQDYDAAMRGCLLLDVRMSGMTGLELFEILQSRGCGMPVLFLTGHADVPMAVKALKQGAFDFLEKPFNDNELVDRILEALHLDAQQHGRDSNRDGIAGRLATLSEREREVMHCILAGKLNKVIADELGIAMRTVEVHRAHVFAKMKVRSAVELAQLLSGYRLGNV
ncbi:response regulator [Rhodocyclaceae bacterium]